MGIQFRAWNGPMPTTAAQAAVSTGTAIITLLQLATPSTNAITLLGWGFTADDPPGADSVVELVETGAIAATVTAHVAAGVQPFNPGATPTAVSTLTLGTAATGYTGSAEGSIVATRVFDAVSLSSVSAEAAPQLTYSLWFPSFARPVVPVSKILRVRATTPTTAVDMRCWIAWEE